MATAKARPRHWLLVASFVALVLLPLGLWGWYLWARAADQYGSNLAFSVRQEEAANPLTLLAGLPALSGASSPDTDLLFDYLASQDLVEEVGRALDLRGIWQAEGDPLFSVAPDAPIEDLTDHWTRNVRVEYGAGSGRLSVDVRAFDPADAQAIALALLTAAQTRINEISAVAREDALAMARLDLAEAEARLSEASAALTAFRKENRLIDPVADLAGQAGLLATLETELAQALINADLLRVGPAVTSRASRVAEADRRVAVIRARIEAERGEVEAASGTNAPQADVVAAFERLSVERDFAREAYVAARAAFDAARTDARRQTRYLAAHILPTQAQTPRYPDRLSLFGLAALFLLLGWSALTLLVYGIRDRRS
ncbi:MAG: capsule biosynthesis protein [Pseudomonadota bacterium]